MNWPLRRHLPPYSEADELQRLRDRVEELEEILGISLETPAAFCMRGRYVSRAHCWRLLCFLAKRDLLTRSAGAALLYGDRDVDDRPHPKIFDVLICQLRRHLRPFDITIATAWGEGWYLDAENRARARALIEHLRTTKFEQGADRARALVEQVRAQKFERSA